MLNIKRVSVGNTSSPRNGNYTRRHFLIQKKNTYVLGSEVFQCSPVQVVILLNKNTIIIAQRKHNKGKVRPRTGHEGPEWGYRYSSTLYLRRAAAVLRLRPRGHWDRHNVIISTVPFVVQHDSIWRFVIKFTTLFLFPKERALSIPT
jgi:hypothetical protein